MPYRLSTRILTVDANVATATRSATVRGIDVFEKWDKPLMTVVCLGFISGEIPLPQAKPAAKAVVHQKKKPNFALGASCSSSEMGQGWEVPKPAIAAKKSMFQIGGSSEEEGSLRGAMHSKSTSLLDIPQNDSAIDSDTDYVDESAIDDDDDGSAWEDLVEDSGKSSMDDKFFQRVDSKVNLTNRPSLITLMLAQNESANSVGNTASQSTSAIHPRMAGPALGASPNNSNDGPLMMKVGRGSNLKPIIETPRSSAQPIPVQPSRTRNEAALSPRTTRRNMLSTELTESLRRHLLWERQQKSSTANAVLKRRHTSHDVANLKLCPQKACMKEQEDDSSTRDKYFHEHAFDGYHSKGW